MSFELIITQTGRQNLKQKRSELIDEIVKEFNTIEEVKAFLIEHYGKMPQGRSKIYKEKKDGTPDVQVGFSHSFWTYDISHNSSKWYQTDWIEIAKLTREPIDIFKDIPNQLALNLG